MDHWDEHNFKKSSLIYTWQDRMLYIGNLPNNNRSYTSNVCLFGLSLYSDFLVNTGGKKIKTRCFFLSPNTVHKIIYDQQDVVVWLLIEPSHFHCEYIKRMMKEQQHHCFFDIENFQSIKDMFLDVYNNQPKPVNVFKEIVEAFGLPYKTYGHAYVKDSRVLEIMDKINKDLKQNIALSDLAKDVGLSNGRLQQLFKEKSQMSIRKYRLWQRLKYACELSVKEDNLSDIAKLSGFYDAAHFSKAFRDTFGITASSFIGSSNSVSIVS